MRSIVFILAVLVGNMLRAQDAEISTFAWVTGQHIAEGAARSFADLEDELEEARAEAQVHARLVEDLRGLLHKLEAENADLRRQMEVHTQEFIDKAQKLIEAEQKERSTQGRLGYPPPTSSAIAVSILSVRLKHFEEHLTRLDKENEALRAQLRERDAAKQPTPANKIVMESIDNCDACVQSDAKDAPRYRASGWLWETVKVRAAPGRMYPRYRVCIGDTCEIVEIRNLSELDGKIQQLLDRRKTR